jgi:Xaa-Pro dipeptidase
MWGVDVVGSADMNTSITHLAQISAEEYAARRRRAVDEARRRGLDGLLVWSRGGPAVDWYGDVLYLAGHHSPIGQIPDEPGWSARAHSALVLPVDGEPTLIVDLPDYAEDHISVSDVRSTVHVASMTADVLREKGLQQGRLGLVGHETLLLSAYRRLVQHLDREVDLVPADDVLKDIRMVKSDAELSLIRRATAIGVEWMRTMMEAAVPGVTEGDVVGEGLRVFARQGGAIYDVAVSSGPRALHFQHVGVPPSWDSERRLSPGDLLHIDAWGPVQGYYSDFVRSTVIGRQATPEQREVLEGAVAIVEHIIDGIHVGAVVGDLYDRGARWLVANGFGEHVSQESGTYFGELWPAFGHGLGLGLESPWIAEGEPTVLRENMVLAIEAFVGRPDVGGAGFEQDVLVTGDGVEILTAACPARWWD